MENNHQKIKGNNNIQIGGDINGNIIKTNKIVHKTEVIHKDEEHISTQQQYEISVLMKELATALSSDGKNTYGQVVASNWAKFYKAFSIPSYKVLPKADFQNAVKWFKKEIAIYAMPKLRRGSENNKSVFRNKRYKAINARATQLGMTREERLAFATCALELKSPLNSLTELSDTRLNKLYKKIMSKTKK